MKNRPARAALAFVLSAAASIPALAAPSTGTPFYGDAPDATHPWSVHDRNRPQPKRVTPGTSSTLTSPGVPPSDAIVLFDGTAASLEGWESDPKGDQPAGPTKWIVKDGAMECVPKSGYIRTKREFGDCQLHVEWAAPEKVQGDSQGRGNSGIFLMGLVEVQVLDNFDNPTYADGFAASVYGVNPPLANALRPPGQFQFVDIIFRRPIYQGGKLVDPGYVTVFCNGVLVQDHTPIEGPTGHMKRTAMAPFPAKGPLKLQDHGNPVRFRNIWYRELPPRSSEGGTDGALSPAASAAKRAEIAASIRADAASLASGQMLRYAESLVYAPDAATQKKVERMAADYSAEIEKLSGAALEARKDEIASALRAFDYLIKYKILAANFAPKSRLDAVWAKAGWEKPKR